MKFTAFAGPFVAVCLLVAATGLVMHEPKPAQVSDPVSSSKPPSTWPDYGLSGPGFRVPSNEAGPLIAYGHDLIARTFANIGPEVPDHAMRFAGNNLACQNCHLDAGTNRYGLPLVGVYKTFPKFSPRDQRIISLAERVNECMTRSMNGQALPDDSREMNAFLAYMRYIGDVPPAPAAAPAEPPPLPADATRGATVFTTVCAACHQQNGLGQRRGSVNDADGYVFPPLWGPDSYNDGAGMDQYQRIVGFVRRNMPRGVDPMHPQLTLQQAWDVSAYVISMPRP